MATGAGARGEFTMIELCSAPYDRRVTGFAGFGRRDMVARFAGRHSAVVAVCTGAGHGSMIDMRCAPGQRRRMT